MAKIIGEKAKVETVDNVDNTKRESSFKNAPHKIPVDMPVEMDFFCNKVKTHNKSYKASDYQSEKHRDDSS